MAEEEKGTVCVTGAAGFLGSWLVKRLLEEGYTVRATVRDPTNMKKVKPLLDLPEAKERLTLWKAELGEEGSFDEAVKGCHGVFHVATPIDFSPRDPENEVIKPAVNGTLDVLRACVNSKSVKRIIFTSSASAVVVRDPMLTEYDESSWTDVEFCRNSNMNGWMYFVSKTMAERAALDFGEENNLEVITIVPPFIIGPFIMQNMPSSVHSALSPITREEAHYAYLKQHCLIHVDDLCTAQIFLFEHPAAKGRYICSSHDNTIFQLAEMMRERYPEYDIPTEFKDCDESLKPLHLSSKKLTDLGFKFKYTAEDMFDQAIMACREKGLIPLSTKATQV